MSDQGSTAPRNPLTTLALPSVLLLIVSTIGYLAYQPPLQTPRPPEDSAVPPPPPPSSGKYPIFAVHAHLWEDPLGVCYRDQKTEPQYLPRGAYEKIVRDTRKARVGNQELLFLPVLLPGSPSGEDAETRKRARYAVLAALGNSGYSLRLNDRMSYVNIQVTRQFTIVEDVEETPLAPHTGSKSSTTLLLVPTKLYRLDPSALDSSETSNLAQQYSAVLVCWINQNQLGDRPLSTISQVYRTLFYGCILPENLPKKDDIRVAIIGPRGSDRLRSILQDENVSWEGLSEGRKMWDAPNISRDHYGFPLETTVYSPSATASFDELWPIDNKTGTPSPHRSCIRLVRCIGTDEQLVKLIIEELKNRGVTPTKKDEAKSHSDWEKFDPIVLVTERDTVYGRSIKSLFKDPELYERKEQGVFEPEEFTYLRGADGSSFDAEVHAEDDKKRGTDKVTAGREYPRGTAQLDYLRRLESQLVDENEWRRRNGKSEICAIGVVGTDFYDKLLVLRALRKRFPRALFFTTDLDAGLLHPDEFGHTRNLLVASHFGLTLHSDLQKSVPPFRDSYQTATFFATLLALNQLDGMQYDDAKKKGALDCSDPWNCSRKLENARVLKPLMFEIGRQRAYQLTRTGSDPEQAVAKVHPLSPRELSVGFWAARGGWLVLFAGLLFTAFLGNFDKRVRAIGSFIVLRPLTLLGVRLPAHGSTRIEGSSSIGNQGHNDLGRVVGWAGWWTRWKQGLKQTYTRPSELATAGIAVMSVAFVVLFLSAIWRNHVSDGGEPFSWTDGISVWPSVLLRLIVVFLGVGLSIRFLQRIQKNEEELGRLFSQGKEATKATEDLDLVTKLLTFMWWRSVQSGGIVCRHPDSGDGKAGKTYPLASLFQQYRILSYWGWRAPRVLVLAFLYYLFGICLFVLYGFPNFPIRGENWAWIARLVTYLAIFVMITSLMFVLDVTRLARYLIRGLGNVVDPRWGKMGGGRTHPWRAVSSREASAWLAIQVIAQHTQVISRSIWMPAVLVLLVGVSRFPYFDSWDISWPLLVLIVFSMAAAVLCGLSLRKAAQDVRGSVLTWLRRRLLNRRVARAGSADTPRIRQLEAMIADIENTHVGAFRPLSQDPFLWALTVPFGGAGGLLFLERLLNW